MVTLPVAQLSVAVAVPVAPDVLLSWQFTVAFAGYVITGAVTSCTVIVCTQVDLLPDGSVAFHVLVLVYFSSFFRSGFAPCVLVSLCVIVTLPVAQLSVAVATPVAAELLLSWQFT